MLKDQSKCKSSDQDKLNSFGRDNVEEIISTKGSCPTDIHIWAIQSFTPVPLKFKLSPIFSLFQDRYIITSNLESNCQKISNTLPIRKWFVPLYHKYCNVMGVIVVLKIDVVLMISVPQTQFTRKVQPNKDVQVEYIKLVFQRVLFPLK